MMNLNIIGSVIAIGVLALALGYGTYAYFSDTETSEGNTIAAGTLDLDAVNDHLVTIGDIKPGYIDESDELTLTWKSNPGAVYKTITGIECETVTTTEPEGVAEGTTPVNNLDDVVYISLTVGGVEVISFNDEKTIGDIAGKMIYLGTYGDYEVGGQVVIQQSFKMDEKAGNEYQSDACTFTEVFNLQQNNAPYLGDCAGTAEPAIGTICSVSS
jgi:predicted ribosomally synthesized peptide with SipW-like signal peptide